jgi:hypothetical protein
MDVNSTSTNKKIIKNTEKKKGLESYYTKNKMTGKNILSLAIKVHRGSRGIAPLNFKFGTQRRYVVNFTPWPPVTRGKSSGTQ